MTPSEFVYKLKPQALAAQAKVGLPWQALVAQAALETGWLRYPTKDMVTKRDSHNLFNIKWTGEGDYVTAMTTEFVQGKSVKTKARFQAYPNYEVSFEAYSRFIVSNPRYKKALAAVANPHLYVQELARAGYATDPLYATKLSSIMRQYMKA